MVNFKKAVAILCSATMIVAAPITAFAADDPVIAAGTGNIVAYSATTVTVPTEIQVSFNPQKWPIYLDAEDTTGTKAQIVSLNYAVSSMATMDRKITVEFEASATGTAATGKKAVEFVDSASKAAPKTDQNPDGAGHDELKIYLAVAGGKDKVTKSRDNTTFAITDGNSNVTDELLADVTMEAATGGVQAFTTGASKTETSIAFKLGKGEYALKSDAHPSFGTTQTDFAAMVEPKELGDIVGFTFTGAMNEDADWTKADLTAIAITPTYTIEEANGEETAVTGGGYNQIIAGEVPPTEVTGSYDSTNTQYRINLAAAVSDVSDITNVKVDGATVAINGLNGGKDIVKIDRSAVKEAVGEAWTDATEFTFTFTVDDVNYTCTIGKNG